MCHRMRGQFEWRDVVCTFIATEGHMIGGSEGTYKEKNCKWIELDLLKGIRSPSEQV